MQRLRLHQPAFPPIHNHPTPLPQGAGQGTMTIPGGGGGGGAQGCAIYIHMHIYDMVLHHIIILYQSYIISYNLVLYHMIREVLTFSAQKDGSWRMTRIPAQQVGKVHILMSFGRHGWQIKEAQLDRELFAYQECIII